MRKVLIRKIGVKRFFTTCVPLLGSGGLLFGIILGITNTPAKIKTTTEVNGKLVEKGIENIAYSNILSGILGSVLGCVLAGILFALFLTMFILLFNIVCKFVGGIEIIVEDTQD